MVGDAIRLEQVFVNLLSNAVKYSHDAGAITCTASASADGVAVTVADQGVGLDPDVADRIFDLFVQGQTSLHRPHGGLGIGLSLARRLTELHGGTITARSAGPGLGAAFTVMLPAAARTPATEVTRSAYFLGPGGAMNARTLVVDDNVDAARALGMLLESAGFSVALAHDADAALARAAEIRPEIVLMDLGLPGQDGYQVAARLRGRPENADVTLVAISGYGPGHMGGRSREVGFDHHLVKPVDCVALLHLLTETVRARRAVGG